MQLLVQPIDPPTQPVLFIELPELDRRNQRPAPEPVEREEQLDCERWDGLS